MSHVRSIALLASLFLASCAGAPPEKPVDVFFSQGAVLMQAAPDPDSKHAVARMLCGKRRPGEGTRDFARCVTKLQDHDRVLSRTRARQDRAATERRAQLCMTPGDFSLTRCYEI